MGADLGLPGVDRCAGGELVNRRGVGAGHLDVDAGGDGVLPGDGGGGGVGTLRGGGNGHQGHGLGVAQHPVGHPRQLSVVAEQARGEATHDVTAGEDLLVLRLSGTSWVEVDNGEGARLWGGRWNEPGRPVVYASSTLSLAALEYLVHETDVWVEITNLLIPGKNDSDEELRAQCKWLRANLGPDVPLHFSAFHPDWKMTDVAATPAATLTRAREIAQHAGLNYVYTGNVHDEAGGSTYCPSCETRVVARDWYRINSYELTDTGECKSCGTRIPGRFQKFGKPFGPRRIPVRLESRA